jgi:hypothetical protein
LGAIEDEHHFLLVCPTYQSVQEKFRGSLPLTVITPLAELLSCQQQGILARFLVQCETVDLNCFIRLNINWVLAQVLFGPLNDAKL